MGKAETFDAGPAADPVEAALSYLRAGAGDDDSAKYVAVVALSNGQDFVGTLQQPTLKLVLLTADPGEPHEALVIARRDAVVAVTLSRTY